MIKEDETVATPTIAIATSSAEWPDVQNSGASKEAVAATDEINLSDAAPNVVDEDDASVDEESQGEVADVNTGVNHDSHNTTAIADDRAPESSTGEDSMTIANGGLPLSASPTRTPSSTKSAKEEDAVAREQSEPDLSQESSMNASSVATLHQIEVDAGNLATTFSLDHWPEFDGAHYPTGVDYPAIPDRSSSLAFTKLLALRATASSEASIDRESLIIDLFEQDLQAEAQLHEPARSQSPPATKNQAGKPWKSRIWPFKRGPTLFNTVIDFDTRSTDSVPRLYALSELGVETPALAPSTGKKNILKKGAEKLMGMFKKNNMGGSA
jgi:hypothetical protein